MKTLKEYLNTSVNEAENSIIGRLFKDYSYQSVRDMAKKSAYAYTVQGSMIEQGIEGIVQEYKKILDSNNKSAIKDNVRDFEEFIKIFVEDLSGKAYDYDREKYDHSRFGSETQRGPYGEPEDDSEGYYKALSNTGKYQDKMFNEYKKVKDWTDKRQFEKFYKSFNNYIDAVEEYSSMVAFEDDFTWDIS